MVKAPDEDQKPDQILQTPFSKPRRPQRGVRVKAYLAETGSPLPGWRVSVERPGGIQPDVIANVRTNRDGVAQLLRLRPTDQGLVAGGQYLHGRKLRLVLRTPDGKEAARQALDSRTTAWLISMPVPVAILKQIGFFGGTKSRSPVQKMNDLCGSWKKRLDDPRDRFVRDDLCLNDLLLSTLAGLSDPNTPLQREAAKSLRRVTRKGTVIKEVAEYASQARAKLRDCLGSDYQECDGTGSLTKLGERLLNENGRLANLNHYLKNTEDDLELPLASPRQGLGYRRQI